MELEEVKISEAELELLLKDILRVYGYDFSQYSRASLKRRINRLIAKEKPESIASLHKHVIDYDLYFENFVEEITVNVTEMFRDPHFFKFIVNEVFPVLSTYAFIRIWHAGSSTGEEVYSMAILLREAGLLEKSLLYATDINPQVLESARKGVFPLHYMKSYSENYIEAGGKESLSKYYSARYDAAIFDESLSKRMVFAVHNLAADQSFNEFNMVICRNVLIYFNRELQERVFALFDESLGEQGFMALGAKESLNLSAIKKNYKIIGKDEKIWKKI
jgi:chemotaxis protein methyltransferase CheR